MTRVVVVGAGLGGLAVAARLAATGHDVTVCEQADRVGGKLGLHVEGGFRFDTGPSLVTMPQALHELFAATGAPLDEVLDVAPVEPIARYRYADGTTFDATADRMRMAANLDAALGRGAGAQWDRFLDRAGAIWRAVEQPFLRSRLDGPGDLLRQSVRLRDLATIAPHRSLRGLGHRYLHDVRLRILLDRYATYAGSDPRRAPAALAAIPWAEQAFGAWYVPGGLYRIAEAVAERAEEHGAVIRTDCAVRAILTDARRVTGVALADGSRLAANVVVANADARQVYDTLLTDRRARPARRRLRRTTPSLAGFVLLLGVRGKTPGLAHHNVLFPPDYDAEFEALFGPSPRPVADPTLYVAIPPDPAVAPPGHEAWFVLVNAPVHGRIDWRDPVLVKRYARHLLGLLAARGVDVRDRLTVRRVLSPADLEARTGAVGGAIYGTASHGPGAAFLRPANRTPVPGLWLVGGSSHPGGGLPLVTWSAELVARGIELQHPRGGEAAARSTADRAHPG
ncbi:MAG: phytoene desaturase family protein [Egibacteraceae bacterium]